MAIPENHFPGAGKGAFDYLHPMRVRLRNIGPGLLITAAFIGPGTVTICSIAGYQFGYALLWALVFSVLTTLVLQEMSARLGLITQSGLSEAIRSQVRSPLLSVVSIALVLGAILIGNTAYEAGNISGAVMGMDTMAGPLGIPVGSFTINGWSLIIGLAAIVLLMSGNYRVIERIMAVLVVVMSLLFLLTAILIKPGIREVFQGAFVPSFPQGSILTIVGLIGTTVVPYNLFLHASSVAKKWKGKEAIGEVRFDLVIAIVLGGIISMAIIITSAAAMDYVREIRDAGDLAVQLEPLLGKWSTWCLAGGLFAAGITSSMTAPLAAAFATTGILGRSSDMKSPLFRGVMITMILIGMVFSSVGFSPISIIRFAQVANGILLPVIGIFLVWVMNRAELLGDSRNTVFQNVLGFIVILVAIVLGLKSIGTVVGLL